MTTLSAGALGIYRPSGLPAWTLNRTSAGVGRFVCGDGSFTTKVGDLVLVAPGAMNDYGPLPDHNWHHQWAVFHPEEGWANLMAWPQMGLGHGKVVAADSATDQCLDNLMSQAIAVVCGVHSQRYTATLAIIRAVLTVASAWRPPGLVAVEPRIQAAQSAAAAALGQEWTIAELAEIAGCSVSRFAHAFRAQVGCAPRQWLERRRIRAAADALLMGMDPVATIAKRVGFTDAAYFARIFRRLTGVSPRAWRRQGRL